MTSEMVVATFNVRHGRGTDGVVDLDRTAAVMMAMRADIVALQELDVGMPRSGCTDQPAVLAALTGMWIGFMPTLRRDGGLYGIAIAASEELPLVRIALPRIGAEEPRGCVAAAAGSFALVCTHLSRARRARAVQTARLARLGAIPVVIAGDLNQRWDPRGPLARAGFGPGRPGIDHVVAARGIEAVACPAGAAGASDHRPVAARIRL